MASPQPARTPSAGFLRVIDISRLSRPFRFVSWATYFLILVGINGVIDTSITTVTTKWTVGASGFPLFFIALSAYCAWTGWKTMGVLGAVRNKHSRIALAALGVTFLAVGLGSLR